MTLKLYYHPLSSFCWKAEIALYENDTPFEKVVVNLMDEASRKAFLDVWPIGQFPVIKDEARDRLVPESSIIIEYLDQHYPGATRFIPADPDAARQVRLRDRFFDLHVQVPMQHLVDDRFRAARGADRDPTLVDKMRARIATALGMVEEEIGDDWAFGDTFTMVDIAAMPALFYADIAAGGLGPRTRAYLERLKARPSVARTLQEAAPFLKEFFEVEP
ncbi:MAG: glutathione S-transferase family protein [Alphaproteobacteria bacterium]|nr:glutathione S-transferase family protein [Alphaproteobacteria bacterium]